MCIRHNDEGIIPFIIILQECVNELCLVDVAAEKVKGEVMDLEQGQQFLNNCRIQGGSGEIDCKTLKINRRSRSLCWL